MLYCSSAKISFSEFVKHLPSTLEIPKHLVVFLTFSHVWTTWMFSSGGKEPRGHTMKPDSLVPITVSPFLQCTFKELLDAIVVSSAVNLEGELQLAIGFLKD